MRGIVITLAFLLLAGSVSHAYAAITDEVTLELVGGEVAGEVRGLGTATVQAKVTNRGTRALNGIRIEAFYSTVNALPDASAQWRPHEFVFEPPLPPGESTLMNFKDDYAAEYVLLKVKTALFSMGLSFNGNVVALKHPLPERLGVVYISTRDLADISGVKVGYDSTTLEITLEKEGLKVSCMQGSEMAYVNGTPKSLSGRVFEINGRSYLPVLDFASMLGLTAVTDRQLNMVMLGSNAS